MRKIAMRSILAVLITIVVGILPAYAQAAGQPQLTTGSVTPLPPNPGEVTPGPSYQLESGDVIALNFPFVPSFNQTLTIEPDGYVTLQAVGRLHVSGLTVPELMQAVRVQYAPVLRDPVVTAELKDFQRPYFIVSGDVEHPGKYDLRGDTTVSQAVAIAGGLRDHAKGSRVVVFHRTPGGDIQSATLDLRQVMKQALVGTDPRLAPGDMLFIPHTRNFAVTDWLPSLWILRIFY